MIYNKQFNNNPFLFAIIILFQSSVAFSASDLNFAPEGGVSDSYKSACDTTYKFSAIGHSPLCEAEEQNKSNAYNKIVQVSGGAPAQIEIEMGNVGTNYDGDKTFQAWWDDYKEGDPYKRLGEPEPCLAELFKSPKLGFDKNWSLTRIGSCSANKTVNINKSMCADAGGTWELVKEKVYNYYTVKFTGDSAKSSCSIHQATSTATHAGSGSLTDLNFNTPAILYHTGRLANGHLPPASQQRKIPVKFVDQQPPYLYYK